MAIPYLQVLGAAFIVSIIWFAVGTLLFLNPMVNSYYKKCTKSSCPALKRWTSKREYVFFHYLNTLVQCILWGFVFLFVKPVLSGDFFTIGLTYAFVIIAVKILPRFFDMWGTSTYPNQLLIVELVNGVLLSFIIGPAFAYFLAV